MNEALDLPALPEEYRWRVYKTVNPYAPVYYKNGKKVISRDVIVALDQRRFPWWSFINPAKEYWTEVTKVSRYVSHLDEITSDIVESLAQGIYDYVFGNPHVHPTEDNLMGTYYPRVDFHTDIP